MLRHHYNKKASMLQSLIESSYGFSYLVHVQITLQKITMDLNTHGK